jgi:hypothetical protein
MFAHGDAGLPAPHDKCIYLLNRHGSTVTKRTPLAWLLRYWLALLKTATSLFNRH